MYTLQRWWDRNGIKLGLACLAIGTAWLIRQTQGAAIYEMYQTITRPFQTLPNSEETLENAQILELQQRLIELESQNQELRELINEAKAQTGEDVVAPVIGRSADHWWHQLALGRGSQDGIEVGDVVIAPGGLVGRIVDVTSNTSRVLLISDPSSRVGITVSRSRSMGYMRGQSADRAVVEFFEKVPDVRRGDVVSTSSLSQLYPSSVPIGRIESVNLNKSPAPEAVITLTAPISSLEWVIVQANPKVNEQTLAPLSVETESSGNSD
ncbi:MAG: rod shape-determining protein MreC [Thainema sp.]